MADSETWDWDRMAERTLAEVERKHIERVLTACRGKVTRAARILGIARATLYRRLAEYAKRPPEE